MQGRGTPVDIAVRTSTFFDASLRLTYTFRLIDRISLDVTAGVENIFNSYQRDFDTGSNRDSGYIYGPALPRSLTVGASVSI